MPDLAATQPQTLSAADQALRDAGFTPVMAAELECYVMLPDTLPATWERFWQPLHTQFLQDGLPLLRIEKERGTHQFELITAPTTPQRLAQTLHEFRARTEAHGRDLGMPVHFAAKPLPSEPSCGLHIHLHLSDAEGLNLYHKTEEWMSDALRFSLGGLLATLEDAMPIFFPQAGDLARLTDADHVPRLRGWGVNNRYCALRIPAHPDPYDKRIEHRMPCANAEASAVIAAVLHGVSHGLATRSEPPPPLYGKY